MAVRTTAFQATAPRTVKLTVPRTAFAKAPLRVSRPAQLQTEFLSPVASTLGSLCASFAQMVMDPFRRAMRSRVPLLVEANNKKGLGCTLSGTRRKRARVSGFRTRTQTVGGRKVLQARRKKGRKNLAPGGMPTRK